VVTLYPIGKLEGDLGLANTTKACNCEFIAGILTRKYRLKFRKSVAATDKSLVSREWDAPVSSGLIYIA